MHGFRASFRTWAQAQTNVPEEVTEAALAHVKGDKTVAAFAHSNLLDKRRGQMDAWAAYPGKDRVGNVGELGVRE
ncbi:hypothetical protein A9Q94_19350 [Rhodobacterales bacterium 56_14_T64]|nr:hypothetical protein A9Q94_19350 [Rhodobacterales bacterium 56_14_T64]